MIFWQLFLSFFRIGIFSFGGGYATIPLIEKEIIVAHHWLTLPQFYQVVAVAGMTPGPVGINCATFVGYRVGGVLGSIVATIAVVLPSIIIVSALYYILKKYLAKGEESVTVFLSAMAPVVLSMVLTAAISIAREGISDFRAILIALAAFILATATKLNILYILGGAGLAGILLYK
ncbi:MAG: chromate transporter [bacterium]|nr:chromate transporter [bacterium]MDD5354571.1 chromate transporter [bacterium]MDD5757175.1 chromate transporter [bacterium]